MHNMLDFFFIFFFGSVVVATAECHGSKTHLCCDDNVVTVPVELLDGLAHDDLRVPARIAV